VEVGDDNFTVSYTVTNIGCGPAGESKTCKYVDGELQETQTCPALASGASHSGAFEPEECPCGETLVVKVCADNDNVVDESDEENNCVENIVVCPGVPCPADYAVYQAKVSDPEERLNELRALRDQKLDDGYVTSYYEHSPMLTLVLSRADSDLVKDGAQLVSRYSIPVGLHVQGMDVNERITKQDVEEALSFTDRLKREVMKNGDAIGAKSTKAIIDFIEEFEGQVKASEGKTFSAALKSSIYYEGEQLRVVQQIVKE
jgi:hypothetical protein